MNDTKNTFGPRCPNHHVVLVKTGDKSEGKKVGICPISGAHFTYDEDNALKTRKLFLNSMGQMEEKADWKVEGSES